MVNVLICGINDEKAQRVYNLTKQNPDVHIVCGVGSMATISGNIECPVYTALDQVREIVDMIIDFSASEMLDQVLEYAIKNKCKLIECSVGYTKEQKQKVKDAAKLIPIFVSQYLSIGVNLLFKLCVKAAETLGKYDVEIIEKYYSYKKNAPGSITLSLAEDIKEALGGNRKIVIGRSSKRHGDEICIHCVRGGNILGEHEILFIGEREVITIKHETLDKSLYAEGAVKIAIFMANKPAGYYTMKDYFRNA